MIKQKIQEQQLAALKSGQKDKLEALRYILAQIHNEEIEKNPPTGGDLTDEETIGILKKIAKELKESIEAFQKGGRDDLVTKSQKQLDILTPLLPPEISDEELQKEIKKIIKENQELSQKNPKAVIGICMKLLKNKAYPGRIMKIINQKL